MTRKKTIISIISALVVLLIALGIFAGLAYRKVNSSAFASGETITVYINDKKDYADLLAQLKRNGLKDTSLFNRLADYMKYDENVKSGKYEISGNISYINLIRKLRSGAQDPVKFTFNNIRFKKDFANRVGEQLMLDADILLARLNDKTFCQDLGFAEQTIMAMFIPNTYELYWDTSLDNFIGRMKNEYERFWNDERRAKAKKIGLAPIEVSILASIVEEETAQPNEYPVVAGLYLNRLNRGMLLQADPTVKYAVGDMTLRRILYKHLEVDSPYNTYKRAGLPPGPIRIPSIQGIDAVLNHVKHNYIYMCAKEDFSGLHNFAVTLSEHNRNARLYQDALNRAGVR